MTTKQVLHFLENDDATAIHYRRFNISPKDKYPTFSICFTGSEINWYHAESLFNIFGLLPSKFEEMIKGQKVIRYDYNYSSMMYNKLPVNLRDFPDVDIGTFSLKISDILTGLEFLTDDDMTSTRHGTGSQGQETEKMPFYVGYKSPETVCFTRASKDLLSTQRIHDGLDLSTSVVGNPRFQDVLLQIFVHYPQQLLRSFHNPVFKFTFKDFYERITYAGNKKVYKNVKISISKVRILRKRPGSNVPCDEHLENDDEKLEQQILHRIECTPPYWRRYTCVNSSAGICNSESQLQKANEWIRNYKNVLKSYYAPCNQMEISSKWEFDRAESNGEEDLRITLLYEDTDYEEITNTKSFDFASLVSGVGGFIGIFLGYSILQIPDVVELLPAIICNLRRNIKKVR